MKKLFFSLTVLALLGASSCQKCGHCERERTDTQGQLSQTTKFKDDTYCGDNGNESGSYRKAAELNCKAWPAQQTTQTGVNYSSSWVADK